MKSLHTKLNEALEKMTSKQRDKFFESRKNGAAVEVQLNCAEAILAGKIKESAPIVRHNGAADNGRVTEFSESAANLTEVEKLLDRQYDVMGLSEAERRSLRNLPPVGSPELTPAQLREYRWGRSIRLSEADSLKLALKVN